MTAAMSWVMGEAAEAGFASEVRSQPLEKLVSFTRMVVALALGPLVVVGPLNARPLPTTSPPAPVAASHSQQQGAARATAVGVRLAGDTEFEVIDEEANGLAECLIARVPVEVLIPSDGGYPVSGRVTKGGRSVSDRPWPCSLVPIAAPRLAFVDGAPGLHTATLQFSGEEIFRLGEDGPYELWLQIARVRCSVELPAGLSHSYRHTLFGKVAAAITNASDAAVDEDGNGRVDVLEVTFQVTVRAAGMYGLSANLSGPTTIASAYLEPSLLSKGTHALSLRFSGIALLRSGLDGPYSVTATLHPRGWSEGFLLKTDAYRASGFEGLLEPVGTFRDEGIDDNGNGLLDRLRIIFEARVRHGGRFRLTGQLKAVGAPNVVFAEEDKLLDAGSQELSLHFDGRQIHYQGTDGPYEIAVGLEDPETYEALDGVKFDRLTSRYRALDFEGYDTPKSTDIALTGRFSDRGVDEDGNGLFDALRVEVEVDLAKADDYFWSGYLIDTSEAQIAVSMGRCRLDAGKTFVTLVFDGEKILEHGVDGPYRIKTFTMYGQSGPATGPQIYLRVAGQTRPYLLRQFGPSSH